MNIKSPVTGNDNTSLVRKIGVDKIINLYKEERQIDVSAYFHHLQEIDLRICDQSGYRFYYPLDISGDDQFYQKLQKSEDYYPKQKWEYRLASKKIAEGKSILEIGSGAGFFLQMLSIKKPENLFGLELNTKAVEDSQRRGLNVINETIEIFAKENTEKFDFVCAFQVLEHIADIRGFILSCLQVLKPGGKLIFAVPNNNPYLYKHDFYHPLNLPPHHAGLWDAVTFSSLPNFFPIILKSLSVEPLTDYKKWYLTQVNFLKEKRSPFAGILSSVPRPLYKLLLKVCRHVIEGRNLLVEFEKL